MKDKPTPTTSLAAQELDKAEKQFEQFDEHLKSMSLDRMNSAPKQEVEPQTKLSQREIKKSDDIYLKPRRSVGSREKFNEKWRADYEFSTEYVRFIAENRELLGETIELWTKPFPGMPAEEWAVPCNKPIWGPRHLAERLTGCKYHRFVMNQNISTGADGAGNQYYGSMAVDTIIQRIDAMPVSNRPSRFSAASGF